MFLCTQCFLFVCTLKAKFHCYLGPMGRRLSSYTGPPIYCVGARARERVCASAYWEYILYLEGHDSVLVYSCATQGAVLRLWIFSDHVIDFKCCFSRDSTVGDLELSNRDTLKDYCFD